MKLQKNVLILSGYNNRGVIAFCRFFCENNIPFYIVSQGYDDSIHLTSYAENVICIREDNKLSLKNFKEYKKIIDQDFGSAETVILPSSEFLNRFLLKECLNLQEINYIIPLIEESLYELISDKYSFGNLCHDAGIKIPHEFKNIDENKIPFVAKPKSYFVDGEIVNDKPILILNQNHYIEYEKIKDKNNFYYQEYIGGKSFYLLYYFDKNGDYSIYSQENLIQQDNGLSIIAAKTSDFHKQKISTAFANVFLQLNFRGLIMIEVKEYNHEIYMIEANPRIWGPSQLILDSGMDLLYQFAYDYNLLKRTQLTDNYKTDVSYFWSGGICIDQKDGLSAKFHDFNPALFFKSFNDFITNDVFLRDDTFKVFIQELHSQNP